MEFIKAFGFAGGIGYYPPVKPEDYSDDEFQFQGANTLKSSKCVGIY